MQKTMATIMNLTIVVKLLFRASGELLSLNNQPWMRYVTYSLYNLNVPENVNHFTEPFFQTILLVSPVLEEFRKAYFSKTKLKLGKKSGEINVLVFDLGGGTFDVSILTINDGVFEVKATAGDTHLGGEDFDNRLVQYFIEEFKRKHKKELGDNIRAMRRLQTACERAKRTLSSSAIANIEIDSLHNGIDFLSSITRAKFEELNSDLFLSTIEHIKKALRDSKIPKDKIDEVILVGGSSRIPKIQSLLTDCFIGKSLNKSVNPDEAVAYGAAVQAAIINGDTSEVLRDVVLLDVTPLSLGVETAGGIMSNVISRNTSIPIMQTQIFTTFTNYQEKVLIKVFEGERALTKDNNILGIFELEGFLPQPRGFPQIEVTFDIDANGILNVMAVEILSGKTNMITISNDKGRLSKKDIEHMISEAERHKAEDDRLREVINARNDLEQHCYTIKREIEDEQRNGTIPEEKFRPVYRKCNETIMWLEANKSASKEDYDRKLKDLQMVCMPIADRLVGRSGLFTPCVQRFSASLGTEERPTTEEADE